MTWHYNIVRHRGQDWAGNPLKDGDYIDAIHEVYLNPDGSIFGRTETPVTLTADQDDDKGYLCRELMIIFNDAKRYPIIEEPYQYAKRVDES